MFPQNQLWVFCVAQHYPRHNFWGHIDFTYLWAFLLSWRFCSPEGRSFVEGAPKALVFVLVPKWRMPLCRLAGDSSSPLMTLMPWGYLSTHLWETIDPSCPFIPPQSVQFFLEVNELLKELGFMEEGSWSCDKALQAVTYTCFWGFTFIAWKNSHMISFQNWVLQRLFNPCSFEAACAAL